MNKKQKLELTWIGKNDHPHLEPRILVEDTSVSHHAQHRQGHDDIFENRLIFGDNLLALRSLESEFAGKVKCVYIDPPFNTQQAFEHYDDGLEHSLWLSLMRDRLEIIHRLLADDGSLFVHIDDNELGYLIAILDEIVGRSNRVGIVTFKQSSASGPKAINPGLVTTNSFILYYVKNKSTWTPNRVFTPTSRDDRYSKFIENFSSPYHEWRLIGLREAFQRELGLSTWDEVKRKFLDKTEEKLTQFVVTNAERVIRTARVAPKDVNEAAREALAASQKKQDAVQRSVRKDKDDYYFLNGEQLIFYKSKVKSIDGVSQTAAPLTNLWDDLLSNNLHNEGGVAFPNGKKPEGLIKRCIELSTEPGDIVLDSFAGSGTTGAVAHKMNRRWLMVELGEHCHTHIVPRLTRIVDGEDPSGITKAVNWKGGGGFRYYKLAPSLLEKDKWGNWIIQSDYNPPMLAEAVCKLMGFTYAPSEQFYWMHGHSSERDFIYVTTQSLTRDQLRAISEEVGDDRSLLVCCKAFNAKPDAFLNLTIKKIPLAVLRKCEWGRDDYSLTIQNLPEAKAEPGNAQPMPSSKLRESKAQADMFAEKE